MKKEDIKRIIKEELVSILKPKLTEGVRGEELMNQLEDLARDTMTIGEPELGKAYAYLYDRINQSARDIDVDAEMLNDFLNEPRGRRHAANLPDWAIDDLLNI